MINLDIEAVGLGWHYWLFFFRQVLCARVYRRRRARCARWREQQERGPECGVHISALVGSVWSQAAKQMATDSAADDSFGYYIALANNASGGLVASVGASGKAFGVAAYVFTTHRSAARGRKQRG